MKTGLLGMVSPMTVCIADVPDDVIVGLLGCAASNNKQRKSGTINIQKNGLHKGVLRIIL